MHNTQKISAPDFAQYEEILQSSILFKNVRTDIISEFISMSSLVSHTKNATIFNVEDKADWFYFIVSGWVKIYRETMDGAEAIIDVLGKNEIFGETAIFEDFIYPFNAAIAEEAILIKLPIGVLAEKIENSANMSLNLLKYTATKNSANSREFEHHIAQNAPQRIGCFLLRLCDCNVKKQDLHLPFDKTLIAAKLGMKPETFSRALGKLKEETGIAVIGRHFDIPSIQDLARFCCGACSSQFPCSS